MRESREFSRIVSEARVIAQQSGQAPSSLHLLLALFTVPNPADLVLRSRRIDEDVLLARIHEPAREPSGQFDVLLDRAEELARGAGNSETRAMHLLVAIARAKGTAAHELLGQLVASTADLAREALSYVVGPMPRRFLPRGAVTDEAPAQESTRSSKPPANNASTPAHLTSITPAPRPASRVSTVEAPAPEATSDTQRTSRISKVRRLAEGLEAETPVSPFAINPEEFPYLASLGRNLTELAEAGRIDPVIGRGPEIDETLDVLGKRRANNPVLVGEPGVGKTAVVEGLALELVSIARNGGPVRIIVELDVAGLVAGTQLRGSLSEKLNGIKDEVRRANGRIIVFIDEIHMLVGAGQTGEGAQDASNELKAALARGEFPCIGATTHAEFQRYFTQDPALERRFVAIRVDEPTVNEAIEILRGVADRYAAHHGVTYEEEAIVAAAQMSARHVRDRALPDKAVAVLDIAGSRVARTGSKQVDTREVAKAVAKLARIPEERLLVSDAERVLRLEEDLKKRFVGHDDSVARVARSVRRNYAGFSGQRPLASFIFLGPTGVGKTELARTLADAVFGGPESLIRVDMSEFSEGHSVAKLVGAPPGYVGYSEGGQLTEAVRRRPSCVVLLDEIEKAHRDAQQLILQVLDEGHLSDGRGRRVDFTHAIIVLTSNLGAEAFDARAERTVGFGARTSNADTRNEKALAIAREAFPPELWNRIEERLVFHPLERADLRRIAHWMAAQSSARLAEDKRIRFELDDSAIEHLLDHGGTDPTLGARPMRQVFARMVEGPLAEKILRGEVRAGDRLRVVVRAERLDFDHLTIIDPRMSSAALP